jgi:hypothetical protein
MLQSRKKSINKRSNSLIGLEFVLQGTKSSARTHIEQGFGQWTCIQIPVNHNSSEIRIGRNNSRRFSYNELSWLSPSNQPLDTKVMLLACRYMSIHKIGQSMTSASSIALEQISKCAETSKHTFRNNGLDSKNLCSQIESQIAVIAKALAPRSNRGFKVPRPRNMVLSIDGIRLFVNPLFARNESKTSLQSNSCTNNICNLLRPPKTPLSMTVSLFENRDLS